MTGVLGRAVAVLGLALLTACSTPTPGPTPPTSTVAPTTSVTPTATPTTAPPSTTTTPSTSTVAPTIAPPPGVPRDMQVTSGPRDGSLETVGLAGGGRFRLYSNRPMTGSADVTRALVSIHGSGRNAQGYFERSLAAARDAGADRDTLVIAPWFEGWSSDAWKEGGDGAGGLSSLAVMDQLVASLSDAGRWPNLRGIVLVGHSAGGQFTQRYAAFGDAPAQPWADPMTFVVMNPSSYAWLVSTRPGRTCDGFDDYKYGLKARQGYVGRLTEEQVRARFAGRRVLVALGGDDDHQNGDMDTACAANAQGPHRLARGQGFVAATKAALPGAALSVIVVPGVDHDSTRMLSSPLLRPTLFGGAEGDG